GRVTELAAAREAALDDAAEAEAAAEQLRGQFHVASVDRGTNPRAADDTVAVLDSLDDPGREAVVGGVLPDERAVASALPAKAELLADDDLARADVIADQVEELVGTERGEFHVEGHHHDVGDAAALDLADLGGRQGDTL